MKHKQTTKQVKKSNKISTHVSPKRLVINKLSDESTTHVTTCPENTQSITSRMIYNTYNACRCGYEIT